MTARSNTGLVLRVVTLTNYIPCPSLDIRANLRHCQTEQNMYLCMLQERCLAELNSDFSEAYR